MEIESACNWTLISINSRPEKLYNHLQIFFFFFIFSKTCPWISPRITKSLAPQISSAAETSLESHCRQAILFFLSIKIRFLNFFPLEFHALNLGFVLFWSFSAKVTNFILIFAVSRRSLEGFYESRECSTGRASIAWRIWRSRVQRCWGFRDGGHDLRKLLCRWGWSFAHWRRLRRSLRTYLHESVSISALFFGYL